MACSFFAGTLTSRDSIVLALNAYNSRSSYRLTFQVLGYMDAIQWEAVLNAEWLKDTQSGRSSKTPGEALLVYATSGAHSDQPRCRDCSALFVYRKRAGIILATATHRIVWLEVLVGGCGDCLSFTKRWFAIGVWYV